MLTISNYNGIALKKIANTSARFQKKKKQEMRELSNGITEKYSILVQNKAGTLAGHFSEQFFLRKLNSTSKSFHFHILTQIKPSNY